jgi:starch phosphorylase
VDEERIDWDTAWDIVTRTYSYTNHTVLPEALEKWPVNMMQDLLPRHMMIIFAINLYFLQRVEKQYPGNREKLQRMSIIEEGNPQHVRMAYLAVVGSHCINGVAALHSELVQNVLLKEFVEFFGKEKFTNVTNGVTPRRWLHQANPDLSSLITEYLKGTDWLHDLNKLEKLKSQADNAAFTQRWREIKLQNKVFNIDG